MEIFLGKPNQAVVEWCKKNYPVGPTETPYVYCETENGIRKLQITETADRDSPPMAEPGGDVFDNDIDGNPLGRMTVTSLSSDYGCDLRTLGNLSYAYSNKLTNVCLPTVTKIGSDTFTGCNNLTSVSLNGLTSTVGITDCSTLK